MAREIKIIESGNHGLLMDRIQCMRDVGEKVLDGIEELEDLRADCCGYEIPSSSSSSEDSSSGSQDFPYGILSEDGDNIISAENGTEYITTEDAP